jgi:uncharacterized protein YbjT (DUF2867 family)
MVAQCTAVVLGAFGSVGEALVRELLADQYFSGVVALSRKALPPLGVPPALSAKLQVELVEEMNPSALRDATFRVARSAGGRVEGFSVLGVGANTARLSLEGHRAVDVALNEAFARGLRDAGNVEHLAFMSAVGANAEASDSGSGAAGMPRYNRIKGESEVAVRSAGPRVVSVFRPSMILGSRHTPAFLEKTLPLLSFLTPSHLRPIRREQIAKAMIAAAKRHPEESAIYHYREMRKWVEESAGAWD